MYAVKIKNQDGSESYMTNFSEFLNSPSAQITTFESLSEAEVWAQNVELSNYRIVSLNETAQLNG